MRISSALTCLTVACATVSVGSIGFAAPCKGSAKHATTHSHRSHVVQQAVVHERLIASHDVRQVAFAESPKDIVDTAVGAGTFKTLAAALGAAELVATLKGDGPFTVFAPTDEAFAKLPAGTVENLLKPENKEKLKEILLLHVVPGAVYAADVVKLTEAKTAGGKVVKVSTEGGVKVGTATGLANVVKTDIKAKNGVIHVIDAVILP
jgi:uncharacterized surface protein with fasciclin (FAS1) repeats